jgi:AcrR family transcriptional regulator
MKDTRQRILAAAEDLSCESGPARVSLEAVAARAGVSKGGLLYHFPSKHDLLRALVEDHVDAIRRAVDRLAPGARESGDASAVARAYIAVIRGELIGGGPPPAGIFAAIAEDPEFIAPLRTFREELRAAFLAAPDPARGALVFLACEGLVHEHLTDTRGPGCDDLDPLFALMDSMMLGTN